MEDMIIIAEDIIINLIPSWINLDLDRLPEAI